MSVLGESSEAICEKSAEPTAAGDEYDRFSAVLHGLLASVCGLLWTKLGQLTLWAYRWICPRRTGAIATAPRLNVAREEEGSFVRPPRFAIAGPGRPRIGGSGMVV